MGAPVGNTNAAKEDEETKVSIGNDCLTKKPVGNMAAAGLRRLRKDRPDLHERVLAGEVSVNAACIEAGFRKKTDSEDSATCIYDNLNARCSAFGISL